MMYHFKRAIRLADQVYPRGNHEVSAKAENDPYFLKCFEAGFIELIDESKLVAHDSHKERSEKLLQRLVMKSAPEAPVSPPEEVVTAEPEEAKPEEPKTETPVMPRKPGRPKKSG